jgi:hypothetical protein
MADQKQQKKEWRKERVSHEKALDQLRKENRKLTEGDTSVVPFTRYDSVWKQLQDSKQKVNDLSEQRMELKDHLEKKMELPLAAVGVDDLEYQLTIAH